MTAVRARHWQRRRVSIGSDAARSPSGRQNNPPVAKRVAKKRFLPKSYFGDTADMIMDCKQFDLPLAIKAQKHADSRRARGAYRKCSEGLEAQHTKPNDKRHRTNPDGVACVLAGVVLDKLRLWEHIL